MDKDDLIEAFDELAGEHGDIITFEGGTPIPCLLRDGITHDSESRPGRTRGTRSADITIKASDAGKLPTPGTNCELSHASNQYAMAVSTDEQAKTTGEGAFYEFTITDD